MKAIIEFNLPEERAEFDLYNQASNMSLAIWEFKQYLRSVIKYPDDQRSDDFIEAFEKCREKFLLILENNNVNEID